MSRAAVVGLLVALAACSASASPDPPGSAGHSDRSRVPVTRVTDGDTIHVTYRGRDERVRLIGVNAPEVPWYGGRAECFGVEAGRYAQRRLSGRSVDLAFDRQLRDRYGRLLAYVYLVDELFNLTLVRSGYAVADPTEPNTSMASALGEAEREARVAGRGLWAACPGG